MPWLDLCKTIWQAAWINRWFYCALQCEAADFDDMFKDNRQIIFTSMVNRDTVFEDIKKAEAVELRLDRLSVDMQETGNLISECRNSKYCGNPVPVMATYRLSDAGELSKAEEYMRFCIDAGADYVDFGEEWPESAKMPLVERAKSKGVTVVMSYHDFKKVPEMSVLERICSEYIKQQADYVKIAAFAASTSDAIRLMSLYSGFGTSKAARLAGNGVRRLGMGLERRDRKAAQLALNDVHPAVSSQKKTLEKQKRHSGNGARPAVSSALGSICLEGRIVCFAMGEKGKFTRILSLLAGAPFGYCSCSESGQAAPGQMTLSQMKRQECPERFGYMFPSMLADDGSAAWLQKWPDRQSPVRADAVQAIRIPSSKSFAQREIIIASLSEKTKTVTGISGCGDVDSALRVAAAFGSSIKISRHDGSFFSAEIHPSALKDMTENDTLHVDVGESGFLARTCMAIGSVIHPKVRITGSGSIMGRDFSEEIEDMRRNGAQCGSEEGRLPVEVEGKIHGPVIELTGSGSSQFVSGMMIASGMLCGDGQGRKGGYVLHVKNSVSPAYADITRECISALAANDVVAVEGDWSSAAFLIVVSAVKCLNAKFEGLNPESLQPDRNIIEVVASCGVPVRIAEGLVEIWPSDCARPAQSPLQGYGLRPFSYDASSSPDLFPVLAALALFCSGTSRIRGCRRLLNKESNRLESIYSEFFKLGACIAVDGDDMIVCGMEERFRQGRYAFSDFSSGIADAKAGPGFHAGHVLCSSHSDHRLAMALIAVSACSGMKIAIDDIECIGKSYPGFMKDMRQLLGL